MVACVNEVWSRMGEKEHPKIIWSHQEDEELRCI